MTATLERSFDEAVAGEYGASPSALYGRLVAELTESAMDAEELLGVADSAAAGETVQRFDWYAGEPALSPDGKYVALPLAERRGPTRVLVLPTAPDTMSRRERQRRARLLERDPQDVLAVPSGPRSRRPVATLWPRKGSSRPTAITASSMPWTRTASTSTSTSSGIRTRRHGGSGNKVRVLDG